MTGLVGYETDIQKLQRKSSDMECLYKSLEKLINSNSEHISRLSDEIHSCNKDRVSGDDTISRVIDEVNSKIVSDINRIEERANKVFNEVSRFETAIDRSVESIKRYSIDTHKTINEKFTSLELDSSRRIVLQEDANKRFVSKSTQEHNTFISLINNSIEILKSNIQGIQDGVYKYINTQIQKLGNSSKKRFESLENKLTKESDRINKLNSLKNDVKIMISDGKEDIIKTTNEMLSNFKDDVDAKIFLVLSKNVDKDLMKRLAKLEGVKDASESRRSAKELIKELDDTELGLLEAERNEEDTRFLKIKLNALKWVLGRE